MIIIIMKNGKEFKFKLSNIDMDESFGSIKIYKKGTGTLLFSQFKSNIKEVQL